MHDRGRGQTLICQSDDDDVLIVRHVFRGTQQALCVLIVYSFCCSRKRQRAYDGVRCQTVCFDLRTLYYFQIKYNLNNKCLGPFQFLSL